MQSIHINTNTRATILEALCKGLEASESSAFLEAQRQQGRSLDEYIDQYNLLLSTLVISGINWGTTSDEIRYWSDIWGRLCTSEDKLRITDLSSKT